MSGWIKCDHDLADKIEIGMIADIMGYEDSDLAVAKCLKMWKIFDINSANGLLPGWKKFRLDSKLGAPGFCDAMIEVGWLVEDADGVLSIPDFEVHHSKSAKRRALDRKRKSSKAAKAEKVPHDKRKKFRSESGKKAETIEREYKKESSATTTSKTSSSSSSALSPLSPNGDIPPAEPGGDSTDTKKVRNKPIAAADVEAIYNAYPRKRGKRDALKAIRKAIAEIRKARPEFDAVEWLLARVSEFAASPAGKRGEYTPYPQKWFNRGDYDDDPAEWYRTEDGEDPALGGRTFTSEEIAKYCGGIEDVLDKAKAFERKAEEDDREEWKRRGTA